MKEQEECLCNLCGETCFIEWDEEYKEKSGLTNAKVYGGYESTPGNGSGALDDLTVYKFNLCEFCLNWLFKQFKISVYCANYYLGTSEEDKIEWKPAEQRVEEDDWRKMKEIFHKENNRRNLLRKIKND